MGRLGLLAVTLGLCSAKDFWVKITTDANGKLAKDPTTGLPTGGVTVGTLAPMNWTACPPITDVTCDGPSVVIPNSSPTKTIPTCKGTQLCANGLNVNLGAGKNDVIMGSTGDYKTGGNGQPGPVVRVQAMTDGYALEIESAKTKQCQSWINTPTVNLWATNTKAILYLFGLCWVFLGVAIVADVFMASIEVITSEEITINITDENGNPKEVQVERWNPTVANLTLMALGSSAPEILLAVLETVGSLGQTPGELGPSTIVGSAAYNLFVITGVCMISVPPADPENGESGVRDISEMGVFYVTAFFSVFAYMWMLIVLMDGVCEVWEALLTFFFFPILVGIAYGQDVGLFCGKKQEGDDAQMEIGVGSDEEKVLGRALVPKVVGTKNIKAFNADIKDAISPQQLAEMKAFQEADEQDKAAFLNANADKVASQMALSAPGLSKKKSKMFWRVQAGKNAKGKPSVFDELEKGKEEAPAKSGAGAAKKKGASSANVRYEKKSDKAFEFNSHSYSVKEDAGHVTLHVHRNDDADSVKNTTSEVIYCTLDGTAKAGDKEGGDYEASKGVVKFGKGERTKPIIINIFHDKEVEDNEKFSVQLQGEKGNIIDTAEVTIIDVSSVGTFQMRYTEKRCNESCGVCKVWVDRIGGSDGEVDILWETEPADIGTNDVGKKVNATACKKDGGEGDDGDYVPVQDGVLTFKQGEIIRPLEIKIKDNNVIGDADRVFSVTLKQAKLKDSVKDASDPPVNGDKATCDVSIQDDDDHFKFVNLVQVKLQERMLKFSIATTSYQDQFLDAVEIDREHTDCMSYLLHCMSLPWKVIMAFIPPTDYGGGWVCFCTSLAATGIITAIVAELAGMFGCMVGLSDAAVALTVVALGTSLPDTFASRLAIMYATDADAAVGNVTGSNSVNVFLGLGLPWVIASLYGGPEITIPYGGKVVGNSFRIECSKQAGCPDNPYVVPTGSLSLSVTVFVPMATACLLSLLFNRKMINGVVGGSSGYRSVWFCIYVGMWVAFLAFAIIGPGQGWKGL